MSEPAYLHSIHHDGSRRYVRRASDGGVDFRLGDEVVLRLRAWPGAPIERVLLRTFPDGEQAFADMHVESADMVCRWWRATIRVNMPVVGYRFLLFTADGVWWLNGSGLHRHMLTDADDFRLLADYAAPAWVRDSVFYQIFPDRFADGDPANNVRDGEYEYRGQTARARGWGERPGDGWGATVEFFGGDLAGIEQRLDTVAELGANALYLNPVFTGYSNHRYDGIDYENVDPHLGGNEALTSLRRALAEHGMRYLLDIVPNHCGVAHPWFAAAQADPGAPTAEFFTFNRHPDDYAAWLGVRALPKLNYRSRRLRELMYAGHDAIFRRWLRPPFSADGWRIDVANMLAQHGPDQLGVEIGQGIRQAVKEENPAAYLLGENFFDGSSQLQGDRWDATMNYAGFMLPLMYWLKGVAMFQHGEPREMISPHRLSTQGLIDSWAAFRAAIPWTIARQQYNLLNSHDTPRVQSLIDAGLNRLAAALLMMYVGVPSVYYGEEIGLKQHMRECMPWDRSAWDEGLRTTYRTLVHLRRSSPALIDGGFQVLRVEEDSLAYLRDDEEERILVVAHRGSTARPASALPVSHGAIPDGAEFVEVFSDARATVTNGHLPLPSMGQGATVWRWRR